MRVLLIGGGGREHALAWKIAQSPLCEALFTAPGNPGTAQCGTNVAVAVDDHDAVVRFCRPERIDFVVVGPEVPLVAGIVVEADGLAAGKGVVVATAIAEAEEAVAMMFGGSVGAAGTEVVIEEFLEGEEASFFA